MTFGSLFAGIGGMDLGLERAGMECKWQVEIDPFCRRVLAKHWPDVRRHDDVTTFLEGESTEAWQVDLIAGGFPCQDVSLAGKRAGIDGERSGLWGQFERVIRLLRPRFVLVENTPRLLSAGLGRVLGDLATLGYDAEWQSVPAAYLGARHLRHRMFLVASPGILHHPHLVKARCFGGQGRSRRGMSDAGIRHRIAGGPWSGEPGVSRVVNGLPYRMDRCAALGNAVVPQVAEWIGRRLMASVAELVEVGDIPAEPDRWAEAKAAEDELCKALDADKAKPKRKRRPKPKAPGPEPVPVEPAAFFDVILSAKGETV